MNLCNRLTAVASFVRDGSRVADIGTDHAYLAVFLIQKGISPRVIAADIAEGPLNNAKSTVSQYSLGDRVELRLCDGLCGISENEVDDIIIAGMGGDVISHILDDCSWAKNGAKRFILQPMSAADDLREYLAGNGFAIEREIATHDGKHVYNVMCVRYTGEKYEYGEEYPYIGFVRADTADGQRYLRLQLDRVERFASSLDNASVPQPQLQDKLRRIARIIGERLERQ